MAGALRLVLGDQLSDNLSALADADLSRDQVLMVESRVEATAWKHHKQKLVLVWSAMRQFAERLRLRGFNVRYVTLEDPGNTGSIGGELRRALQAWRVNPLQVGFLGVLLLLLHLFWVRVATLMYALFFADLSPTLDSLTATLFQSGASLPFLIAGTIIGAAFAAVAFAVSVVSIPMLLDRRTNAFTAMATSIMAVRVNLPAMALWAFIIVFLTMVGIATMFVGLIVTLPLIGHASWHAYKDLVTEA